jgi:type II secretory ATPase GspE/PulE/Tfp pilus assembly ATPase PilB-like protein
VIREVARETTGLKSLREDGLTKVLKGMTTKEEVDRVAY